MLIIMKCYSKIERDVRMVYEMLNQLVIVGRLVKDPELRETEDGRKVTNITLAVPRSYKNSDGEYETDYVDCVLWSTVAETTSEYCKKGDLLGVKGRVQTRTIEKDNSKTKVVEVVTEKVTFLSSRKQELQKESFER